jgi:magnesium chelatase family protein
MRGPALTSSARVRELVLAARDRQVARLQAMGATCNAELDDDGLRSHGQIDHAAHEVVLRAYEGGRVGARGRARVLRVARTIADLGRSERVRREHVAAALSLHQELYARGPPASG